MRRDRLNADPGAIFKYPRSELVYMKCAVIPINRSDFTFESSFSSIVRTYELFKPEKIIILYAEFNRVHLEKLRPLFDELRSKGIQVVEKDVSRASLDDLKRYVEEEKCDKAYLIPTSGANIIAVYLALLHAENKDKYPLVNYIFSFGPWTNYYYPFVPRSLEKVSVIGDQVSSHVKLDLDLSQYLSEEKFTRGIQILAKKANELTDVEKEKANFTLTIKYGVVEREVLSTDSPKYDDAKSSLAKVFGGDEKMANNALNLAGVHEILVDDEKIEKVAYGRTLIIDTNQVYYGIHTHEIRDLAIPYCVHNEILSNVNKKEDKLADAEFYVYESLMARSKILPSESTICDIAIPKIDADLVEGSLIVTSDKRAFERWNKLAVSRYADIKLAELGEERTDYSEVLSVIFNLAVILYISKVRGVKICSEGNKCVDVDKELSKLVEVD
jgi:hypothetical protein